MSAPHGFREDEPRILLVEDAPGDARLFAEVLRGVCPRARLQVATDGLDALAHLRRQGTHRDAPRPDLIVLDLNLPRMSGHEFLVALKADVRLATIPVIVLSTSFAPRDVQRSYLLHANAYLTKPRDLAGLEETVRSLHDCWLNHAALPREPD